MNEHFTSTMNEFTKKSRIDMISNFYEILERQGRILEKQELELITKYMNSQLQNKPDMVDMEKCLFNPFMPYETIMFNVEEFIVELLRRNPRDADGKLYKPFEPIENSFNIHSFDPTELFQLRNNLNLKSNFK